MSSSRVLSFCKTNNKGLKIENGEVIEAFIFKLNMSLKVKISNKAPEKA